MKKTIKILSFLFYIISIINLSSCSFGEIIQKNDREYQLDEIIGTYKASDYRNGTSYDYYLIINSSTGKAYYESYTFEGDRLGYPHNVTQQFEGKLTLTKTNIQIGSYTGYITTSYDISIHINNMSYNKD